MTSPSSVRVLLVALLAWGCSGDTPTPTPPAASGPGTPPGPPGPPLPGGPGPGGPGAPKGPGPRGGAGGNPLAFGEVDLTRDAPADARLVAAGSAPCAGCDVVVITVCSLRRDQVGAYGGPAGLTPNLDALAASGMRFDAAYAASNFTLPSLTSLFTGQFPSTTGVMNWDRGIGTGVPMLAEVLGYYGYTTGAFTIDAPSGFRPEFGLDRGFQRMRVSTAPNGTPDGRRSTGAGAPAAKNAADWIRAQPADRPLLAVYHDRNAHYPYVVAAPTDGDATGVRTALWEEGRDGGGQGHVITKDPVAEALAAAGDAGAAVWRETYREAVGRMDAGLGELFAAIDARGRREQTVLVVVADHGESLNDHGELLHGISYFDPVVHVPLLVDAPGVAPGSVTRALASHVDLFPTIAELVGAPPPAGIDGVSLVPVLRGGESVRRTTIVEGGVMLDRPDELRGAFVSPPWALLLQPPPTAAGGAPPPPGVRPGQLETHLYDADDARQDANLAAEQAEVVAQLRARWDGFRAARAGRAAPTELLHDPAFIELLQRTGYDFSPTGATSSASAAPAAPAQPAR